MRSLSATCLAIALADQSGALRLVERAGRFGAYVSVEDNHGLIEVAMSMEEARTRVAALRQRWQ